MGRTINFDENTERKRKKPKHAKNHRGSGMRIINKWSEESSDDHYNEYDSYNANTTFNTTQKEKPNGY
jgi:hypothetical protein